ncbi:MAG: MFS transporter [Alphaproteobacteria bacterium]|nr:MFS transporter [Alphaproteobacteria bacterium]
MSLSALALVVFVAMTGFGIFIPMFPFIGLHLNASATEITFAMGAYSVGQLIAAPLWGRVSDLIGRKPVLILGLLGAAGSYLLITLAGSILEMGLARLFGGLMAGNIGAAFAAAADLADEKTRARNMGVVGAAFGFGFIVGPALAGLAIGAEPTADDFHRLCHYAAGFAGAAALAAALGLRETAPLAETRASGPAPRLRLLRTRPLLTQLVLAMFLLITANSVMETIFGIWADHRVGWRMREVAYLMAALGLLTVLMQGGAAGLLARRYGEPRVFNAGVLAFVAGFLVLGFASGAPTALAGLGLLAVGAGLAQPALQSLIAAQAAPSERGAVMGLSQSASALGRAVGAVIAGPVFDGLGPGAPFFLGAALLVLALTPAIARPAALNP